MLTSLPGFCRLVGGGRLDLDQLVDGVLATCNLSWIKERLADPSTEKTMTETRGCVIKYPEQRAFGLSSFQTLKDLEVFESCRAEGHGSR